MNAEPYLPLVSVSHDDAPALLVVLCYAHLSHVLQSSDIQSFINLIFLKNNNKSQTQKSHHTDCPPDAAGFI